MKVSILRTILHFTLCAGIFSSIFAQTISIKGKVVDGSGPVEGAAVHLLKADKLAFTNASGEFTITENSKSVNVNMSGKFINRPVVFNGTEFGTFIERVYNIKGSFKALIPPHLSNDKAVSGYENKLFRTPGIYITEARHGGETRYGKLGADGSHSNTRQSPRSLQKTAGPDELVISALGKTQQRMEISDFGKDVGTIKLTDNGKGKDDGHVRLNFKFEGRDAVIVVPNTPHPAKPWIWRSTFYPDDDPMLDHLMLSKGYYRVHLNQKDLMGNDKSIEISAKFHDMLVNYFGFWPKVVMSGWSQAGFHIFRFAGKYPDKVSVVAADAATCNARAWPGVGSGKFLSIYGMSRQEAEEWKENPSDSAIVVPMVKGGVAVIHEVRVKDKTVNKEWAYTMQELYEDLGGTYKLFESPGGHTDHFLKPELIEPFITEHNKLTPPMQ